MAITLTGNHLVDGIAAIPVTGNVTPVSWYQHIRYTNKRGTYTDHLAIALLSDILYWYRPSEVRDEATGQVSKWKKKFKAEMFQRSYEVYAALMGASWKQVKTSFQLLKSLGLVKLHFETVATGNGKPASNVMYVEPIPFAIATITYTIGADVLKQKVKKSRKKKGLHTPVSEMGYTPPCVRNGIHPTSEMGGTYTDINNGNYFLNIKHKHKQATKSLAHFEQRDRVNDFPFDLEDSPPMEEEAIATPCKAQKQETGNPESIKPKVPRNSTKVEKQREVAIEKPEKRAIVFQLNDAGWLRMPRLKRYALTRWLTVRRMEYQLSTLFSNVSVATDAKGNTKTEGNQIVFKFQDKESLENDFFEDSPLLELRDELHEKNMLSQDVFNDFLQSVFLSSVEWLESRLANAKPTLAKKSPAFIFYNGDQNLLHGLRQKDRDQKQSA